MRFNQRGMGVALLLALLTSPLALFAQSDAVSVVGSGIATPLFETLTEAADTDLSIATEITGSTSGIEAFCAGEADVVNTTRVMSLAEETNCQ